MIRSLVASHLISLSNSCHIVLSGMNPQNKEEDDEEELNLEWPVWYDSEWVHIATTNALLDNTSAVAVATHPPPSLGHKPGLYMDIYAMILATATVAQLQSPPSTYYTPL